MLSYRKCVSIILLKDSKVFSGMRIDIKDAWQLPQGGVNEDENFLEAAKRELFEETNISSIEVLGSSSIYKYEFPIYIREAIKRRRKELKFIGQEVVFFAFKFLGEETEIDLTKKPQEFIDWKWASPEEVIRDIVSFKKPIYKKAFNELKLL